MDKRLVAFERLLNVMDDLREKCPWDRKQTIESLRKLTIEETYELSEAIINNDDNNIKEEIGDLMLHLVFYSKIASETNRFDITEVLNSLCDKLIDRHPHIYGDAVADTEEDVKRNWEKIKLKKGRKSVLEGVPSGLPSMVKAQRIQDKARHVGFDWEEAQQVVGKIHEELNELQEVVEQNNPIQIEKEMGDVLFAVINYARLLNLDAEKALELTNKKFINRFQWMERYALSNNLNLSETSLQILEEWWTMAKKEIG
ncbi:MAG: nucleoside triphosphate pyrophosphohydrolase [Chitinophagales bacterium]|nr:nucleoside triphosphate pyrophosphohydrolase [Chitinophagales bacterium]MCZ2392432.1 nucleoside triphosphate pyrophosphohydrolase [Chitinophagales bacterium]